MDIFQMLNNHQLAAQHHHQQQQQQPLNPRNETKELFKNFVEKKLILVGDNDKDPLSSYNTFSSMANEPPKNENINDNDNVENKNNENDENDDPYRMPIANEDLLQRQFNLYRYYLSQYPELFQEYFQIQHQQQLQQNLMEQQQQQQQQQSTDLYLINNNNNNYDDNGNDNHVPYQSSQQKDFRQQQQQHQLQTIRKLPNKRINNGNNNMERCRFLCRCSKCCQKSDSSIWSEQSSSEQQIIESSTNINNDGLMMMNNQQNDPKFQQQHRRPVQQATSNALYYLNANNLLEDERYEHLSRVITPPNAFLNIHHHHQQNQNQSQQSSKNLNDNDKGAANDNSLILEDKSKPLILYSDKRTQTDTMELKRNGQTVPTYQKVNKLAKNLQRQLSLAEEKREKMKKMKTYSENNHLKHSLEFSSEPIYHTINDGGSFDQLSDPIYSVKLQDIKYNNDGFYKSNNRNWWNKSDKKSKIPYEQNDLKNQIQALYDKQRIKFEEQNPNLNAEDEQPHRIPTSNNGIPCSCERCRESRGMNLTTELLPIDTQIPLQTMDNMDSFFQDSSMAELICRIM